ncbi:hypothetical protein PV386_45690, partial [Streptomyces europaeiscabiei]|nr:hypothetical protein [Streptomyces europaeiscabiei]
MRTKDMRRSVVALAALAMAGACTAQGIEVHGGQRQPVRIDGTAAPSGAPKQDDGDKADGADNSDSSDSSDSDKVAGDSDGKRGREQAPPPVSYTHFRAHGQ